jgi:DUF1680 family protein
MMQIIKSISRRDFIASAAALALVRPAPAQAPLGYPVNPLALADVEITDAFWLPRIEKARTVSLPMLLDRAERGSRIDGRLIEATAYFLTHHPDPALQNRVEALSQKSMEGMRRLKGEWPNRGDGPFFGVGHFIEGAVAWQQATGSRKMLDGAIEITDDLDATFGPTKRRDIANHEEIELALVKLYRATNEARYLRLAKFLVDTRGTTAGGREMYGPYSQDHMPVKAQTRAIGHCVRATYLYNGVTDLAAFVPDADYRRAALRIWDDAVTKRTFLTGGIGSYRDDEDYGDDYDLPNIGCWNEICAAVGNVLWNQRLFQLTEEAKYVDVLERILYNAVLAGVSLSGDKFLYQTPLKALPGFERQSWFGPNCCPPNITRLMGELGAMIYASSGQDVYVNLFIASKARLKARETPVDLVQETRYPYDGSVHLRVNPASPARFAVLVRIPGWARNEPMPGGLYRYVSSADPKVTLTVNGKPERYTLKNGYARVEREWRQGDVVELSLPMTVHRAQADSRVAENRGMVALERGPLVYCAEAIDNQGSVFNLVIPDHARLGYKDRPDLLGGMGAITGSAVAVSRAADGSASRRDHPVVAVPFFAFGNRGTGEMAVWLARDEAKAVIPPKPTIASRSRATSSCGSGTVADNYPGHKPPTIEQRLCPNAQDGSGDIRAIADGIDPPDSEDGSGIFLRLRPQSGDQAWVQYDFAEPARVSSTSVYWKDDKQYVVVPKSWRLLFKDREEWKPVRSASAYGVDKDRYNEVRFEPVTTSALRMEIELRPKVYPKNKLGPPDGNYLRDDLTWFEGGVIEWRVA